MENNQPTITSNLTSTCLLRKLPMEVRLLVYSNALALQPGFQAPALLLALAADPELYDEALPIFKKINFVLTLQNQMVFKAMETKELLKIRHLTVAWQDDDIGFGLWLGNPLLLAMKVLPDSNNLETITLDLRKGNPFATQSMYICACISSVKSLILGANGGINNITAVFDFTEPDSRERDKETKLLEIFFAMLGVIAKQRVSPKGPNFQVWIWESKGMKILESAKRFTEAMINSH